MHKTNKTSINGVRIKRVTSLVNFPPKSGPAAGSVPSKSAYKTMLVLGGKGVRGIMEGWEKGNVAVYNIGSRSSE